MELVNTSDTTNVVCILVPLAFFLLLAGVIRMEGWADTLALVTLGLGFAVLGIVFLLLASFYHYAENDESTAVSCGAMGGVLVAFFLGILGTIVYHGARAHR